MDKKKIVAIQGSFRNNGMTSAMLKFAVEKAKEIGHEVLYINLFDKKIEYCRGCRKCLETADCIFTNDDFKEVAAAIKAADVIMLASPVYWANVPAIVKNLFDRMSGTSMEETDKFPKPRLAGKKYIMLTTCNTQAPFSYLCGQTKGLYRVTKEYFKTSGISCIGKVAQTGTGKHKEMTERTKCKIEKLVERI